jgi:ferredoxin--NADP+ reductase
MSSHDSNAAVRSFEPDLPDVVMHRHKGSDPATGVVVSNEPCTGDKAVAFVRHVEIDVSGTRLVNSFVPGQSFGVLPPGEDERGKPHKIRLYSCASPTGGERGDGTIISTTVKRLIDEHWDKSGLFMGVASNLLCDLEVGDKVLLTGPSGKRFLIPRNADDHDFVFFATSTGIAPFRGMIHDLLEAGVRSRVVLVAGSPYRSDLLYHPHFQSLQAQHPNFAYIPTLSREPQGDGKPPMHVQGRFGEVIAQLGSSFEDGRALVYMCGVIGMELGILQQMATQLSFDVLRAYLTAEPDVISDIANWDRKMIRRTVKPTERVFSEVF